MCDGKENVRVTSPSILFFIILFIFMYLFLAVLGLHCCVNFFFFPSCIVVASLGCGARALGHMGFSKLQHVAQQLWFPCSRVQAQQLWHMGLVTPRHRGSPQIRDRTCVFCIGRQILYH